MHRIGLWILSVAWAVGSTAVPAWAEESWVERLEYPQVGEAVRRAGRAVDQPEQVVLRATAALADAGDLGRTLTLLMRGVARVRRSEYRAAIADLSAAATHASAVDDVVHFWWAEALFHAGEYARAEKMLGAFERRFPHSPWRHRAHFRLADCQFARQAHGRAIRTLRKALRRYSEYPHAAAARYMLAQAESRRGRRDLAAAELRRLIRRHPAELLARVAERELAALESEGVNVPGATTDEVFRLGVELRRRKYYDEALDVFQSLQTDMSAAAAHRRRARWQIGRALYGMERFEEALQTFADYAANSAAPSAKRLALRWQAHCLERLGRFDDAVAKRLEAARHRDDLPTEEIREIAWLYFNGADYAKAEIWFAKLSGKRGASARDTRWMQAWLDYRQGRYRAAADAFLDLQRGTKRQPVGQYVYWQARALGWAGDIDTAVDTYRSLILSAPMSYYAYQAMARLDELGRSVVVPSPVSDPTTTAHADPSRSVECDAVSMSQCEETGEPQRVLEASVDTAAGSTADEALVIARDDAVEVALTPKNPADRRPAERLGALARAWGGLFPDIVRAHQLAVIGEDRQAAVALRVVSDELRAFGRARSSGRGRAWRFRPPPYLDHRKDVDVAEWGRSFDDEPRVSSRRRVQRLARGMPKDFWAQLAIAFEALGDFHYLRRHFGDRDSLRRSPEEAVWVRTAWARFFPRAYAPTVEHHAAHFGLDPYVIWALMTVESAFNPDAVSRVGARGLMQVMPHTAGLIADRMAWRDFGAALLFEPEVIVELAAWYFHQLMTKFNGQLPLAIASYNAGPHRVASWLRRKGHLPMDEFIEEIPYTEARRYTKKVLEYLMLYRRIYARGGPIVVRQVIDPDFGDNINF